MDVELIEETRQLAREKRKYAAMFRTARKKAGIAKKKLDLLLTAHMDDLRSRKRNLGIDMAYIMLIEKIGKEAGDLYSEWKDNESEYESLEPLIEAHGDSISFEQSVMRWQHVGENWTE